MGMRGYFRRASPNERGPVWSCSSRRSMAILAINPSPPKTNANPTATSTPSITSAPVYALKTQSPNTNARTAKAKKTRHKHRRHEVRADLDGGFILS